MYWTFVNRSSGFSCLFSNWKDKPPNETEDQAVERTLIRDKALSSLYSVMNTDINEEENLPEKSPLDEDLFDDIPINTNKIVLQQEDDIKEEDSFSSKKEDNNNLDDDFDFDQSDVEEKDSNEKINFENLTKLKERGILTEEDEALLSSYKKEEEDDPPQSKSHRSDDSKHSSQKEDSFNQDKDLDEDLDF
jgi:hypothetical protein